MDGSIDGDAAALLVLMKEWKDIIKGDANFRFDTFSVTDSIAAMKRKDEGVPPLCHLARKGNSENLFK